MANGSTDRIGEETEVRSAAVPPPSPGDAHPEARGDTLIW
jgi:hypothetical protein